MSVNESVLPYEAELNRLNVWHALCAGWRTYTAIRRRRRELLALSHLEPRLLRDIGFEPDTVYQALDGCWDQLYLLGKPTPYATCRHQL